MIKKSNILNLGYQEYEYIINIDAEFQTFLEN